jgi:hypothetical protein
MYKDFRTRDTLKTGDECPPARPFAGSTLTELPRASSPWHAAALHKS